MSMPVDLERLTVLQAMRDKVVTIGPQQTLEDAARVMHDAGVTALPVIDASQVPGIITERDIGSAVASGTDAATGLVRDFQTAKVVAATRDWSPSGALEGASSPQPEDGLPLPDAAVS